MPCCSCACCRAWCVQATCLARACRRRCRGNPGACTSTHTNSGFREPRLLDSPSVDVGERWSAARCGLLTVRLKEMRVRLVGSKPPWSCGRTRPQLSHAAYSPSACTKMTALAVVGAQHTPFTPSFQDQHRPLSPACRPSGVTRWWWLQPRCTRGAARSACPGHASSTAESSHVRRLRLLGLHCVAREDRRRARRVHGARHGTCPAKVNIGVKAPWSRNNEGKAEARHQGIAPRSTSPATRAVRVPVGECSLARCRVARARQTVAAATIRERALPRLSSTLRAAALSAPSRTFIPYA